MADENLWGELDDLKVVKTPVAILREQAEILSRSTGGLLVGEVKQKSSRYGDAVAWELQVRVPAMNDYIATLLRLEHPVALYPLISFYSSVAQIEERRIADEEAFKHLLGTTLKSTHVRRLLSALVSQARS